MSGIPKRMTGAGRELLTIAAVAIVVMLSGAGESRGAGEPELWQALRSGGHVAMIRHAIAPGTGDPDNFTVGDCATQRNLSAEGRAQAERIGRRFRDNGIAAARVLSSQWCRCLETAELLQLGTVTELTALNSLHGRPRNREPQTKALKEWLMRQDAGEVHVLVSHQTNISALTGFFPGSGEIVIIRVASDGGVSVAGSIKTN